MQRNMTPKQIKDALALKRITQSGLARDLGCTPQHVFRVIKDPTQSFPVAKHVATALGMNPSDVWPETYEPDYIPQKPGRPISNGFFDDKAA